MDTSSLPKTFKALTAKNENRPTIQVEELPLPKPGKNQVLVKMAFAPLNQTDLLCSDGFYRLSEKAPYPVGSEGSGVVVAVGEDLKFPHKVGDRVHLHYGATLAEYALQVSEEVSPIKGDLSFEEAASHIINPCTVSYMVSKAVKGGHKTVISTAASSALGKMLIRALKEKGIKTINTVRQDKYIGELKKEGADYVLNSESADFEAQLKEIATKEGVTIAFDAINGDFPEKILRNLPANSTVYVYGFLAGGELQDLWKTRELEDGKKVTGLVYRDYLEEAKKNGELERFYDEIHTPLRTIFKTDIHKIYDFKDILEAIEYYRSNSSKGKILIQFN